MSKRTVTELQTSSSNDGQAFSKVGSSGLKRDNSVNDPEIGEFEDAWEDEIDSDEEVVEAKENGEEDEGMEVDDVLPAIEENEEQPEVKDVYLPGRHTLGKDEILEPDESVYVMRHSMNVNWPCLSFDILRDSLGDNRLLYPATSYIVAGTQADIPRNNELYVYKMGSLHKTQKDGDESDDEDDDNDDEGLDEDAVLEFKSIPHFGGVNRIRAQPFPQGSQLPPVSHPYHVATWADTGKVNIWDIRPLIESLDTPGFIPDKNRTNSPVYTISSHGRAEGFALDWASSGEASSPSLRLLTGDVHGKIFHTTSTTTGFATSAQPFTSHTSSVEDLQWSPAEQTVFASCSADRSIRIWDVRVKGRKNVLSISPAHDSDVNVISWNKCTTYLLLSGGDEGGVKVWDLRSVKGSTPTPSPVASFTWHKAPITSIEWHPTEDSIFAASGADDQVTLWDLSVEQDADESGMPMEDDSQEGVPPQLLFVHQGQKDVKEVHWHPQIPGAVISTAYDGFNIFKTISV